MSTYQELPSIYRLKRSLTDVDQIANEYFEKVTWSPWMLCRSA